MTDPGEMTPRRAVSRYLDQRRPEISDGTYSTYRYRLKLFVEWCQSVGIGTVGHGPDGGVQYVDGVVTDITNLKKREKTLKGERDRFEMLFETLLNEDSPSPE